MKLFQLFENDYQSELSKERLDEKISSNIIENKFNNHFYDVKKEFFDADPFYIIEKAILRTLSDLVDEHTSTSSPSLEVVVHPHSMGKGSIVKGKLEFTRLPEPHNLLSKITLRVVADVDIDINDRDQVNQIKQYIVHELVHAVQVLREEKFVKPDYDESDVKDNIKDYLKNVQEIEAYASQAKMELRDNLGIENASQMGYYPINKLRVNSKSYNAYYHYFANSQEQNDKAIWKRFLKKLHQHFEH